MKKQGLKSKLYYYLKARTGVKINGGELENLATNNVFTGGKIFKPSNVGRRLRELAEAGSIKSEIINKTVWYWYEEKPMGTIELIEGRAVYVPPKQEKML